MMAVITGSPGSGTRYMARLLQDCGIAAEHERQLPGYHEGGGLRLAPSPGVVDVSWAWVPYLDVLGVPTVHLTRHPLKVIATLNEMRWPDGTHQAAFQRWFPGVYEVPPGILRCAAWYQTWTALAQAKCREQWRVEDISPGQINQMSKWAGIPPERWDSTGWISTPTDIGARGTQPISWHDLQQYHEPIRLQARSYGYREG